MKKKKLCLSVRQLTVKCHYHSCGAMVAPAGAAMARRRRRGLAGPHLDSMEREFGSFLSSLD